MSDPREPNGGHGDQGNPAGLDDGEAQAMRDLLKRSLSSEAAQESPPLLPGVQRRLRRRSRGKFFADGWSTTQARASHVLVALITLLVVVLAYYALGPLDVR